jgi:hypothetical protein
MCTVSADSLHEADIHTDVHDEDSSFLVQREKERVASLQEAPIASALLTCPDDSYYYHTSSPFVMSPVGEVSASPRQPLPSPTVNFISKCPE